MTFIFPALLAGLALAALPVVMHLIMRQQPKQIRFPAFQFLARKATTNRRKLRLRHLLLLAMRMLMIALMCLALARPRVLNEQFALSAEQPAAAVFILDTSPTMGYTVGDKTKLDEAKSRALEIIAGLPAGSRIAVLDPAETNGDWQPSPSAVKERIATRELQASAGSLADPLAIAYRLFGTLAREAGEGDTPPPRFIYVLTDRAPGSWDASRTRDLIAARNHLTGPPIQHAVIDLGEDKPADVAITEVRVTPQVILPNKSITISAFIQSTGQDVETQVQCRINGQPEVDSKSVQLQAGQSKDVSFNRRGLSPGVYQAEISLATTDALAIDNVRYVTFEVREARPVLIVCDQAEQAKMLAEWMRIAIGACDVKTATDPALGVMSPADLAKYRAIMMLSVKDPSKDLWDKLDGYVAAGGGLIVFPGGDEMKLDSFNQPNTVAQRLLPATFRQLISVGDHGVTWTDYQYQHSMMAKFRDEAMRPDSGFAENPPRAFRYWEVVAQPSAYVLVRYADQGKHPAIIETTLDRRKHRGKVIVFTTPFDDRRDSRDQPWNDYTARWYFCAITVWAVQYVGGETDNVELNHLAGRAVSINLPANIRGTAFNLVGPGLSGPDSIVAKPEKGQEVRLTQTRNAGNYLLSTSDRSWSTGFSVNIPAEKLQLMPKVPAETLAELFGPDSIVSVGKSPISDKLAQHFRQPVELFPWLMILLLFLFVVENYLANRFYRKS